MSFLKQAGAAGASFATTLTGAFAGATATVGTEQPGFLIAGTLAGMAGGWFARKKENRRIAGCATGAFLAVATAALPISALRLPADSSPVMTTIFSGPSSDLN